MSTSPTQQDLNEIQAALINEVLERIDAGEPLTDGFAFLDEMDQKYGA